MARTKIILLAAIGTLAITAASPAFALNPQPLPPRYFPTTQLQCANGHHIPTAVVHVR